MPSKKQREKAIKKASKLSPERMRKHNPTNDPEVRDKISKTLRKKGINPIRNLRNKFGRIDRISPPQ